MPVMVKVEGPAAMAWRTNRRSRNARSLFIKGPTAWAREASDSCSYHSQNPRSTGSVTAAVTRRRQASWTSRAGMSARVTAPEPGGTECRRVRQAARKMSSVRGPQNAE